MKITDKKDETLLKNFYLKNVGQNFDFLTEKKQI